MGRPNLQLPLSYIEKMDKATNLPKLHIDENEFRIKRANPKMYDNVAQVRNLVLEDPNLYWAMKQILRIIGESWQRPENRDFFGVDVREAYLKGKRIGTEITTQVVLKHPESLVVKSTGAEEAIKRTENRFTRDKLGDYLYDKFKTYPPFFCGMAGVAASSNVHGMQLLEIDNIPTNIIVIRVDAKLEESQKDLLVTHEKLHYVMSLGHGVKFYWKDKDRSHVSRALPKWFMEGLTHYFAEKIFSENYPERFEFPTFHGLIATDVLKEDPSRFHYYPKETETVSKFAKIVGEDLLWRAFLTGDLSKVNDVFEKRGGNLNMFFNEPLPEDGDKYLLYLRPTKSVFGEGKKQ